MLNGALTDNTTRNNSTRNSLFVSIAAPQSTKILQTDADDEPYIFELAGLCAAIDEVERSKTADERRAAVKKMDRSGSPVSSGSGSETSSFASSSDGSVAAPFGQNWVAQEDCPLIRVTKKEPAKLRPLALMDVWVVDIPAQYTIAVFEFIKRHDMQASDAGHLKRVKRQQDASQVSVLLKTTVIDEAEGDRIADALSTDAMLAPLAPLRPYIKAVPAAHAESSEQLASWGEIWPISYIPMHAGPRARSLPRRWTEHQLEWVRKGMQRVVEVAQASERDGELPVACMVSESYDLTLEPEKQPSPFELASHHDTRRSTGNTLCHAFRNLIARVAEIDRKGARQTQRTLPTSKGATLPYLLTGMTLFTSHEPCLLCSMALLHSRVQTIIYAIPADGAGGCGSLYDVHEDEGLNHKFEAWQITGIEGLEAVEVDP